jgi:hypothetical protein
MREIFIDKNDPYYQQPKAFYILVFSVFVFGCLIAYLFIPPEQKIVQVPVEKIKYVDRVVEKKVEVPVEKIQYVDRVVEKRVEVPVARIQYVDRVVEKKVEVPVEVIKYVEVPVEKAVYSNQQYSSPYNQNWRSIKLGMTMSQVSSILGEPKSVNAYSSFSTWYYGDYSHRGSVTFQKKVNYDKNYRRSESTEQFVSGWSEP